MSREEKMELMAQAIQLAKEQYESEGELEFDEYPNVSLSDDLGDGDYQGAYVQAWVYVSFDKEDE